VSPAKFRGGFARRTRRTIVPTGKWCTLRELLTTSYLVNFGSFHNSEVVLGFADSANGLHRVYSSFSSIDKNQIATRRLDRWAYSSIDENHHDASAYSADRRGS
jgi:hypothetical protein